MTLSADVTRRAITLGTRDATTGWRKKDFYPVTTIECIPFARGASFSLHGVGCYAREDAMFLTQDVVEDGDQLVTYDGTYYEAVTVQKHPHLSSFLYREVQAHELPLWQQPPSSTATWKTGPADARNKIKAWIDANARDASILKDDGLTEASWACLFSNPPYPLRLEFRGASNMNGLYTVDQPTSKPLGVDGETQAAYAYEESVPVHIVTVDSTGCSGHQLQHRMEAELRYVTESFPTGSLIGMERRGSTVHRLGSMQLYDTTVTINYRRGLLT